MGNKSHTNTGTEVLPELREARRNIEWDDDIRTGLGPGEDWEETEREREEGREWGHCIVTSPKHLNYTTSHHSYLEWGKFINTHSLFLNHYFLASVSKSCILRQFSVFNSTIIIFYICICFCINYNKFTPVLEANFMKMKQKIKFYSILYTCTKLHLCKDKASNKSKLG